MAEDHCPWLRTTVHSLGPLSMAGDHCPWLGTNVSVHGFEPVSMAGDQYPWLGPRSMAGDQCPWLGTTLHRWGPVSSVGYHCPWLGDSVHGWGPMSLVGDQCHCPWPTAVRIRLGGGMLFERIKPTMTDSVGQDEITSPLNRLVVVQSTDLIFMLKDGDYSAGT